jgi:hypothetical protein
MMNTMQSDVNLVTLLIALPQLKALQSLGLKAKFITNGNSAVLENEIRNNRPVACGWLHHGTSNKPTGGGHWGVICGFTPTHFVVHDPFGEGNITAGGYVSNSSTAGKNIRYSKKIGSPAGKWMVVVLVGRFLFHVKKNTRVNLTLVSC